MKQYKILVIDDDPTIINTIIDYLDDKNPNYIFFQANNGLMGIEVAKKHKPDLIISDWEMPQLSGIETIKKLKAMKETSEIPIVMMTGIMISSEHLNTAFEAGAIDFIRKPIDEIELSARIHSMLILTDYYKETIELKNKELVHTTMNILKNNEFNLDLIKQIKKINLIHGIKNKQLSSSLSEIEKELTSKIKNEAWNDFSNHFKNVFPNFNKNLSTKFPELTPAEVKLASLLRLKLSTKEIASLIFITPESVKTARNRLRKKLKLSPQENLIVFLMSI